MTHIASSKEIDLIFNALPNGEFKAAYDEVEQNGKVYFIKIQGGYKLTEYSWYNEPDLTEVHNLALQLEVIEDIIEEYNEALKKTVKNDSQ